LPGGALSIGAGLLNRSISASKECTPVAQLCASSKQPALSERCGSRSSAFLGYWHSY